MGAFSDIGRRSGLPARQGGRVVMLAAAGLVAACGSAGAQTWLIDFGADTSWRGASQVGPDDNGNVWNSLPPYWYVGNLVRTDGEVTGAAYAVGDRPIGTDSYNGPLGDFVSDPLSPAEVDFVFIDSEAIGILGGSRAAAADYMVAPDGRFAIKWLNPSLTYDATFFGSFRYAVEPTTIAAFTDGSYATEAGSVTLDVGTGGIYNDSQTVALSRLVPTATDPLGRQLSFQFGTASGVEQGYLSAMALRGYIGYLDGGTTSLDGPPTAGYVAIGSFSNGDPRSADTVIGNGTTVIVNSGDGIYWNSILEVAEGGGTIEAGVDFAAYALTGSGDLTVKGPAVTFLRTPGGFSGSVTLADGTLALGAADTLGTGTINLQGGVVRLGDAAALGTGPITVASGVNTLENAAGATALAGNNPLAFAGEGATLQAWANGQDLSLGTGPVTVTGFNNLNAWAGGIRFDGVISGDGTLNWWGVGTLTLSAANDFTGTVVAADNDGSLILANVDALQAATLRKGPNHTVVFAIPGTNTYRLAGLEGTGSLDLGDNSLAITATADHEFAGSLAGAGGVTLAGPGIQTFSNANAHTGPTVIRGGSLAIAHADAVAASGVTVADSGRLTLPQDGRIVGRAAAVTIETASGGLVDLGAGGLSIGPGGTTETDLRAAIVAGRNGGAWNGASGITSTLAAASSSARGVGYVVNGDGSATVSLVAPGDVNISGRVDVFDLVSINSSGTYGTGQASVWSQGDVNYDGVTSVFDLVGINAGGAYGQGNYFLPPPDAPTAAAAPAAVPEPTGLAASLGLFGVAAAALAARRRRCPGCR